MSGRSQSKSQSRSVKQVYVLWADVTGYEQAIVLPDSAVSGDPVRRRINRLERAVLSCLGKVISRTSFGLLATFDSADSAVRSACEMQRMCSLIPQIFGAQLVIRVGIDCTSVEHFSSDQAKVTELNAYRLATLLGGDSIVLAPPVMAALSTSLRHDTYPLDHGGAHAVYWQDPGLDEKTALFEGLDSSAPLGLSLHLRLAGKCFIVDGLGSALSIGRDPNSGIVVAHNKASRQHCKLLRHQDTYLLFDMSTNGTYITSSEGVSQRVKQGSAPLKGRGWITLGYQYHQSSEYRIDFEVIQTSF